MKTIIAYFLVAIGFISCSKKEQSIEEQIIGEWTWIESSGGFAGDIIYPDKDNYESLTVSKNTFKQYVNDKKTVDTSYKIISNEHNHTLVIHDIKSSISIENNTLTIDQRVADGYSKKYKRK